MKKLIIFICIILSLSQLYGQVGRMPYQTIRQSYKGDTSNTTLGTEIVEFSTNLDGYSFNKPVKVQDTTLIDLIKRHALSASAGNLGDIQISDGSGGLISSNTLNWDGSQLYLEDNNYNLFISPSQIKNISTASYNIVFGRGAGSNLTTGSQNTFIGTNSGNGVNTGEKNTLIGYNTRAGATGTNNISIGNTVMTNASSPDNNVLIGNNIQITALSTTDNIIIGQNAGYVTNSNNNVIIGSNAGYSNVSGAGNVFIGYKAGYNETGGGILVIENSNSESPLIWGDFENDLFKINGTTIESTLTIADSDGTPDVSGANVFIYEGASSPVTITDFDNPSIGATYRIIGSSDTYQVTIQDSGNFNLSADWTGGAGDVLSVFVQSDNNYIEVSRSDN